MVWKKNWFGRLLWLCQLGMTALLLGGVCSVFLDRYEIAEKYPISPWQNQLLWLGISEVLFILVSLLMFILFRMAAGRLSGKTLKEPVKRMTEVLLFAGLFLGGILYRLLLFPDMVESNAYFELGAVSSTASLQPLAHGALYVYILLLRGLFLLFGNNLQAGIILQVVLQSAAAVVLYGAVRKIAGRFLALAALGFMMFTPTLVKSSLSYTPEVLYLLLFSLVFSVFSFAWDRIKNTENFKWYHYGFLLVVGIGTAFLIYLDVLGIVLLVLGLSMFGLRKNKTLTGFAVFLLSTFLGVLGMFSADALQSGSSLPQILSVWTWLFCPAEEIGFWNLYVPFLERAGDSLLTAVLIFLGLFMGLYGFLVKDENERQRIWFLFALSGVLLSYDCPAGGNLDRGFLGLLGLMFLAVSGVWTALFAGVSAETEEMTETEAIAETEKTDKTETAAEVEETAENEETAEEIPALPPVQTVKYIENPLPLPKKHVKKRMDYAFEISDEALEFDFEILENDDFDF